MASEHPIATTTATSVGSMAMPPAMPSASGMSRLAAAELEMTVENASAVTARSTTSAVVGSSSQATSPSSQVSIPVAPIPAPSAMPPATSHRTCHWILRRSSPVMTWVASRATTGTNPTVVDAMPWNGSVSHSSTVPPATT